MAKLLDQIDVNPEDFNNISGQTAGDNAIPAGVYEVAIDEAFIRKTDSGAKMFELKVLLEDGEEFKWSTCTQSGDEKGNKATYTDKTGKEKDLPGVIQLKHFLDAIGEPNPDAEPGEVKFGDKTITALCLTTVQGKKLKLGVQQYENEYNGNIGVRNDVIAFMDVEGNNKDGDHLEDKISNRLKNNPVRRLKKAAGNAPAKQDAAEVAEAGW